MYFIIDAGPDGVCVMQKTKEELLQMLTPDKDGDTELDASKAMFSVPDVDPNYWRDRLLIIRGEIVVPKKKEVVTRYEIE